MTSMNSTNLVRAHCRNCSADDPCQLFELNNATSVEKSCVCGHQRRDHIVLHLNPVTGRLEPLPGVENVSSDAAPSLASSAATIHAPMIGINQALDLSGVPSAPSMDVLLQALLTGQLGRFISNNTVAGSSSSNNSNNNNNNNRQQTRKRSLPQQQGLGRRVLPVLAAGPSANSSSSNNATSVLSDPPFSPSASNSASNNSNVQVAGDVGAPGQHLTTLDVEAMVRKCLFF